MSALVVRRDRDRDVPNAGCHDFLTRGGRGGGCFRGRTHDVVDGRDWSCVQYDVRVYDQPGQINNSVNR